VARYIAKRGKSVSKKFASFTVAILMLTAVVPFLSACHTVQGAGQDISATGQAIDKAAKKTTP
jgi:predicted small secreted protein